MHTWRSLSLARSFFCDLTRASDTSANPVSPTTTCGERWTEEEEEDEGRETVGLELDVCSNQYGKNAIEF